MGSAKDVLVITTPAPAEVQIKKHLKPVSSHVVAGTNIFSDFFGSMSDVFGGRSGSYQKQLVSLYDEAIERIKYEAFKVGSDCVVGLSIDIDEISGKGKSMFMITAIGTAVILEKKDHKPMESKPAVNGHVESETVYKLKAKKRIIAEAEARKLDLTKEKWDFIIENRVKEAYPFVIDKLTYLINNPTQYTSDTISTFLNNTESFLRALEPEERVRLIYTTLRDKTAGKKAADFLEKVIDKECLLNFKEVTRLLEDEDLEVKKRGLRVSVKDLQYYKIEDIDEYLKIVELVQESFQKRGTSTMKKGLLSSKEKECWQCECGKVNDMDITYCTKCSNDIYGFSEAEVTPKKALAFIENKISLIKELLEVNDEQQVRQQV